ncbi:MAG TPA: hypothetical protein PK777_02565 [Thermoguttaceae bacterium]|nr:hypothetical protein [Thermoguttaceae bacterium]
MRRILLDANVIIKLHELGVWTEVLLHVQKRGWRLLVAETVVSEVDYFRTEEGHVPIDLTQDFQKELLDRFDMGAESLRKFRSGFDPLYAPELDPGETECLAFLVENPESTLLCTSDSAAFRTLGLLNRSEKGISLEEFLQQIGLGRRLPYQYTEKFRVRYTHEGQRDFLQRRGFR